MDHNLYPGWEKIGFKKGAATYEFVDANDRNIHYDCRAIKEVRRGKTLIKVSSFDAIIPFKKDERLTRITLYTNEMSKGVKLVVGIEKVMNELRKANPREYIYS